MFFNCFTFPNGICFDHAVIQMQRDILNCITSDKSKNIAMKLIVFVVVPLPVVLVWFKMYTADAVNNITQLAERFKLTHVYVSLTLIKQN